MPKYNEHECDIYLIDGAPTCEPTEVQAAVIFTSHKEDWFDQMRKYPNHSLIYFLNWTFPELQLANKALNLKIKDSALWERYLVFGGTARYTLSRKQGFVDQGLKDLNDSLNKIGSFEQLKKCFDKQKEMKDVVHRLMAYVPNDPNNLSEAPMVFASRHTSRMVHDRLQDQLNSERAKLVQWLDGAGQASTFQAHLFEAIVHENFRKGGNFQITELVGSTGPRRTDNLTIVTIAQAVGIYRRFGPKFPLEQGFFNVYRIPSSKNQESIDSYFLTEQCLFLFQVTRNADHGVKADGLVDLLKQLGKLDAAKNGAIELKLIFVVPTRMKDGYRKQEIQINWVLFDQSEEEIKKLPCDRVSGIKENNAAALKNDGITTIGDLVDAKNAEKTKCFKHIKEKLLASMQERKEVEFLKSINQYVLGMSPEEEKSGSG